jgi:dTDP-4-dehydrorhamnose reductase
MNKRKKILITGCKGQLGCDLQKAATTHTALQSLCTDIDTLDLTQEEAVRSFILDYHPDFIIHCAAYTAVDKAEDDEEKASLLNTNVVEYITGPAEDINARFIHISTDYVFDGMKNTPYLEDDKVNPQSVYGRTKLLGEKAALKYENSMIIRTAWLYSTGENNFVNTMLKMGSERSDINVVNDQYGSPTYSADLAEALLSIVSMVVGGEKPFVPGIFHYSNEGVCTWFDFARRIMQLAHLDCRIHPVDTAGYPTKAARPKYSVLSKDKIKTIYGLTVPAWEDALRRCLEKKVMRKKSSF